MDFLSILNKGVIAMIEEAFIPKSFKKGETFEDYVRKFLFIKQYYDLLEQTHRYNINHKD
jgi:hypothetical protein